MKSGWILVWGRRLSAALLAVVVAACQTPVAPDAQIGMLSDNGEAAIVEHSSEPAPGALTARSAPSPSQDDGEQYFVEFRARSAYSYGHTSVAFGRLNAAGEMVDPEVAGLHPASDSAVPYLLGHVVPVPSETGETDGDLEDEYLTASWRILLSKPQYDEVVSIIRRQQATSPVWHAALYNCNAFAGSIARAMGYRTPFILLMPKEFVTRLREMNENRPIFASAAASL